MHKTITEVVKILGVCVVTAIVYAFMFGTSNFFVFDGTGMGGYDGAIAQIITAVERPMAIYYRDLTYTANERQMNDLDGKVRSRSLIIGYEP